MLLNLRISKRVCDANRYSKIHSRYVKRCQLEHCNIGLNDAGAIIKQRFLQIFLNLLDQVIDLLCQPDIIYLLEEMNITSNNSIRISIRRLLDIVRTSRINFIKAIEKVDSLGVNAWEALFLQWYPMWESNQAQCI